MRRQGQGGGAPCKLPVSKREAVKQGLEEQTFWTLEQIKSWLEEELGINYSLRHLRRILTALGMYHYKPQPIDYRRDAQAAERLQQRLQATFDALQLQGIDLQQIAFGFADETAHYLHANTARVWSFFKRAKRMVNTEKIKQNTLGFYALQGQSIALPIATSSEQEMLRILPLLRQANAQYPALVIVWDNLPAHKSKAVERLARRHQIYLVNNLPYAPDLNPIEKIWKKLKYMISQKGWIPDQNVLWQFIANAFTQLAAKMSWVKEWIDKILNPILGKYNIVLQ